MDTFSIKGLHVGYIILTFQNHTKLLILIFQTRIFPRFSDVNYSRRVRKSQSAAKIVRKRVKIKEKRQKVQFSKIVLHFETMSEANTCFFLIFF